MNTKQLLEMKIRSIIKEQFDMSSQVQPILKTLENTIKLALLNAKDKTYDTELHKNIISDIQRDLNKLNNLKGK